MKLRLGCLAGIVVKIGNVVAWLVAMIVITLGEESIEFRDKGLTSANPLDQRRKVLRNKEGVLIWQTLRDVACSFRRVERTHPASIRMAAASEAGLGIDHIQIV